MITRTNEDSGCEEAIAEYMKVRIITSFCPEGIGYIGYMTHNKQSNSRLCYPCDVIAQNYKQIYICYKVRTFVFKN
jgi:hypothetical protein